MYQLIKTNNIMEKRLYRTYDEALNAAKAYAKENNAYVADRMVSEDDRSLMDADRFGFEPNFTFSGETAAFNIIDNDSYEDIAHFAYWE